MTCIIGIKTADRIYLGGDSCISSDNLLQTIADPKVWKKGTFVLGSAGSLRVLQIIKYKMKIPPINQREPTEYMVTTFVDAMRKALKEAGGAGGAKEENKEEQDNSFLVAFKGRMFEIDGAYAICEVVDEYIAIGSGTDYALGALYATKGEDPEVRIKKALEAASYYADGVRPPFHIIHTK